MNRFAVFLSSLSLLGFIVDRWLKNLALHEVTFGSITGGFRFELFPNPDIAFSLEFPKRLTMILIPILLVGFVWYGLKAFRERRYVRVGAIMLVVIPALSNYLDRVSRGYVVDYLSLGEWFPVFNLSDVLIVVGLICLAVSNRFDRPVHPA